MKRPIYYTTDGLGCRRVQFGAKDYGTVYTIWIRPLSHVDANNRVLVIENNPGGCAGAWRGATVRQAMRNAKVPREDLAAADRVETVQRKRA